MSARKDGIVSTTYVVSLRCLLARQIMLFISNMRFTDLFYVVEQNVKISKVF